jgi:hypothetical protein
MPMNKMISRVVLVVLSVALSLGISTTVIAAELEVKPYIAKYKLFRSGKEHGTAERELSVLNNQYQLRYKSSIKWMIFSDERFETSTFLVQNNQVKPLNYKMERKGTGPDRSYSVTFDRDNRKILSNKKRKKRRKSRLPGATKWSDTWLDPISYQQQLNLDLRSGKKVFNYSFINRKGVESEYQFVASGEELLMLPYGKVKTVKVERIYDEDSDRQTIAWFAPELDYALVRIWKGKSGVEQFDIQLNELIK